MDEARDVHLMPTRRDLLPQFKLQKRCCNHVVGHIFAVGGLTTSGVYLNEQWKVEEFWHLILFLDVCR